MLGRVAELQPADDLPPFSVQTLHRRRLGVRVEVAQTRITFCADAYRVRSSSSTSWPVNLGAALTHRTCRQPTAAGKT